MLRRESHGACRWLCYSALELVARRIRRDSLQGNRTFQFIQQGIEDAVQLGLSKVSRTVKNIKSAWVNEIRAITGEDGSVIEWRVNMRINFIVE